MSDYGFWADTEEEVTREELEERFDESLDSLNADGVQVAGLTFTPSDVVREMDPIAYRTGLNDYHDMLVQDGEIVEEMEDEEV